MNQSFLNYFIPGASSRSQQRPPQYYDILFAQSDLLSDIKINLKGNRSILSLCAFISTLYQISGFLHSNSSSPMIFCITNQITNKSTYVSVLEFTAEEKTCVLPHWLYEFLQIDINPEVHIALIPKLPKAQYLKFQPHETLFIEQTYHPKQILEVELRNYLCLHVGDTIQVEDNTKIFKLDVLEIKPDNEYKAAILLDADIDFDLAPPLDYNETKQLKMNKQSSQVIVGSEEEKQQQQNNGSSFFIGKGIVIDQTQKFGKPQQQEQKQETQEEYDPRKFKLTHGVKTNVVAQTFEGNQQKIDNTYGQTKKR